jgi:hypothetical protein
MTRTSIIGFTGLIALVATLVALVTPGTASAAGWQYWQLDQDRCWDAITIDANVNGYWEAAWFDLDGDCRWDTRMWNSVGGDAFAESMTHDMNEDGRWEYWLVDTDQRVGHEVVYFDDNADGYYDRWAYVPQAAPNVSLRTHLAQVGSIVGGTPRQDGPMGLVTYIAGITGSVAWAAPDSDGDGYPNNTDRNPYDPRRP